MRVSEMSPTYIVGDGKRLRSIVWSLMWKLRPQKSGNWRGNLDGITRPHVQWGAPDRCHVHWALSRSYGVPFEEDICSLEFSFRCPILFGVPVYSGRQGQVKLQRCLLTGESYYALYQICSSMLGLAGVSPCRQ